MARGAFAIKRDLIEGDDVRYIPHVTLLGGCALPHESESSGKESYAIPRNAATKMILFGISFRQSIERRLTREISFR
jgi:hypothetical protein